MKLVYGISRWTNASRASARHIDNGSGKPLCNDKRKCTWETEEGEPTFQKCIRLLSESNPVLYEAFCNYARWRSG